LLVDGASSSSSTCTSNEPRTGTLQAAAVAANLHHQTYGTLLAYRSKEESMSSREHDDEVHRLVPAATAATAAATAATAAATSATAAATAAYAGAHMETNRATSYGSTSSISNFDAITCSASSESSPLLS